MCQKLQFISWPFLPDFLQLRMDFFCSMRVGDVHKLKGEAKSLETHTGGDSYYVFSRQLE